MELAEYRAVQALIGPYGAEFSAAEHGTFPLGTSIRRTPPPLMPPSGPSQMRSSPPYGVKCLSALPVAISPRFIHP